MDTNKIFNSDTITIDGGIIYPRLYAAMYPKVKFVEDFRPDYFIKREQFNELLLEIYKTIGEPIYKSFMSGKCLEIRLLRKYQAMFFVSFVSAQDMSESKFKFSSKDLEFAEEVGDLGSLQDKIEKLKASEYNARLLAPWISEDKLEQAILRGFYYPIEHSAKGIEFCEKYDALKFDRMSLKPPSDPTRKKIGFNLPHND